MGWKLKRRERYALIEEDEDNRRVNRGTFYIGPRHVKHRESKEFIEYSYVENPTFASEANCRVFVHNAYIALEVYDYYVKMFDPDYENVSVYDERFEVQYLFRTKPRESWRSVDAYNPSIQVVPLEDGVEVKKIFDTDYGAATLEVSYIMRIGARLKHNIIFTNPTSTTRTFRVVLKLSGIVSDKVKHSGGEERITGAINLISPYLLFGEDSENTRFSENLFSLGEIDEDTFEWTPTTLKSIELDTHANGSKVDIYIGNYVSAQGESLEIDPAVDTWFVAASSDDGTRRLDAPAFWSTAVQFNMCGDNAVNDKDWTSGFRFLNIAIPKGSTIASSYIYLEAWQSNGAIPQTVIEGEDVADAATFSTAANYDGRARTAISVNWTPPAWVNNTVYKSSDIQTITDHIINTRGDWASGNDLVIFWRDVVGWIGVQQRLWAYSWDHATADPPKLEITWTVGAPAPVGSISVVATKMGLI